MHLDLAEWWAEHGSAACWAAGLSVLVAVVSMVAVAILIVRLPADYLREKPGEGAEGNGRRIARNVLGVCLMLVGLAMLALPGPGLVVLLLGIVLTDFPGKNKAVQWIISRGRILRSANRLRRRFGRPPLKAPRPSATPQ